MTHPPALSAVQHQFEQWRQTRTSRTASTPLSLRQQAVELCEHYPISQVVAALKVNHTSINAWRQASETTSSESFIPIDISVSNSPATTQATLIHPSGTQLQLANLDAAVLQQLINHFLDTSRGAA